MFGEHFLFNEQTMGIVEEIGRFMPGGFFIYLAEDDEKLLYANNAVLEIFGCKTLDEFKELTGYTFKGMLHPEDYKKVSESIVEQIESTENRIDHVEYRIIRKDKKIRWVDDYGHYIKSEVYGGLYYVFISDITDKHERNLKMLEEVQSAEKLASLMGSVASLLSNMPAMSFSKDAETGKYLACNQSFAEYARKKTPKDVIGLTDHDIFDKATADHFVEDDKKTLQMDEPYIFFEDVPDASGVIRNLQTTKLKFLDDKGRLCLLGMCVDVTQMTRIKANEVKQREMEEKIALQEKILEEERQRAEQDKLITALAANYRSVYYIELDKNEGVCYRSHSEIEMGEALKEGERFNFTEAFSNYAKKYIKEEYRDSFISFIQPESIRDGLAHNLVVSFRYMIERNGKETYEMVRFAGVRHPEDRDDHIVHAVGACFSDVDAETRENLNQAKILSDALKAAEEANKAKTAFLSNMSHEIRTPMNAIIGLDSIALNEKDISPKMKDYLEKIGTSAQHLLSIINDILDMSRIESGRMIIKSEEFSFSKLMDQVRAIIGEQCRDKKLEFDCKIEDNVADYYIGDDMKIRQIMINILGNSVKFTPQGGRVSLHVEQVKRYNGKSTLSFVFSDTGIGISPEFLPHIFEAFSQEDSSLTNRYGSTGLGMPITKSLVELMNGRIEVESQKNKGTTFTATITLKDSALPSSEGESGLLTPHEMVVLAIDDDPVACERAKLILGQLGIKCETALSGQKGVEMVRMRQARWEPYNLILVDWKMPGMDGIATTKKIREIVGNDSAIIILTSFNWDEVADEALEAGVDSFVSKPLLAGSVMDEFRQAFAKKSASKSSRQKSLKGKRVLLAEDLAINAEIMMMVLSMEEISAERAENGKQAVEMFEKNPAGYYDAILMDMRMPVMDGLEASRAIRESSHSDAKTIPIVALTANAFDEDVQRSMQAGLNAHLTKPIEPPALFETLRGLLR